jgi:hypothetical protein
MRVATKAKSCLDWPRQDFVFNYEIRFSIQDSVSGLVFLLLYWHLFPAVE